MTLKGVRSKAILLGISFDVLEAMNDEEDPKEAVIQLLMKGGESSLAPEQPMTNTTSVVIATDTEPSATARMCEAATGETAEADAEEDNNGDYEAPDFRLIANVHLPRLLNDGPIILIPRHGLSSWFIDGE